MSVFPLFTLRARGTVHHALILTLLMIGLLIGLATKPLLAQTQAQTSPLTPLFGQCMDAVDLGAMKISQWTVCYQAELKRQDQFLNAEYQLLKTRLAPSQHAPLLAGQRAWIAYRDAWCKFQGSLDQAPSPDINALSCLVDLTAEQTKKIKESQ